MSETNVPPLTITLTGVVQPDETDIFAGVAADISAAFGGDINPADETPQGQLATSEAAIIGDANAAVAALFAQVDPNYAFGKMQDAIGRLYFMERIAAEATSVQITCVGAVGIVIPAGCMLAIDRASNVIYTATSSYTVPASGSVLVSAAAATTGPIPLAAGGSRLQTGLSLYQSIGLDYVTNPQGVLGSDVEGRAAFELRRQQSVALNSRNTNDAVLSNLLAVPGVIDAYVTDNPTTNAISIGGVSVPAGGVYYAAYGGAASDIAAAILAKRPPGTPMAGNTTVSVTDTNSGYATPPTYSITFEIPGAVPIYFAVAFVNSSALPSNAQALAQAAIVQAFAGGDGGPRARIGSTLFATRFVGPVASLGTWAQIRSLTIGTAPNPTGQSVTLTADQIPTVAPGNITATAS